MGGGEAGNAGGEVGFVITQTNPINKPNPINGWREQSKKYENT